MLNLMNINFHNTFFRVNLYPSLTIEFSPCIWCPSSKHFYMIDPPPKNWFRFTDVAKHNKVSNISCKKSGRRIMVGNLEITVKNGEDGWNSITIGTPYKGPTSQSSSKSVALLKILNWFMSWIKRLHSKEHSIVRKTWVLCKGLDLWHFQ